MPTERRAGRAEAASEARTRARATKNCRRRRSHGTHFSLPRPSPLSSLSPLSKVLVSLAFIAGLARSKAMDFGGRPSWASARAVLPLALFWVGYVQAGVIALRYLTVPMYR
jgi:hypothetical protein